MAKETTKREKKKQMNECTAGAYRKIKAKRAKANREKKNEKKRKRTTAGKKNEQQ